MHAALHVTVSAVKAANLPSLVSALWGRSSITAEVAPDLVLAFAKGRFAVAFLRKGQLAQRETMAAEPAG